VAALSVIFYRPPGRNHVKNRENFEAGKCSGIFTIAVKRQVKVTGGGGSAGLGRINIDL